jgi:DNA processing protein
MLATTLSREEELLWLALRLIPGLGTRKAGQLIERFGTPRAVFRASRSELEDAGIGGGVAQSICSGCSFDDAVAQQQKLLQTDTTAIVISEPRYPPKLREIFDPPILMFARGRIELLDSLMLGIVGTRRPTPYGMAVSERLAADLALAGLTIVSGLTRQPIKGRFP